MTVQRKKFFFYYVVVASSVHLDQLSNTYETTLIVKMTKHRFIEDSEVSTFILSITTTSSESDQIFTIKKYVFVFNIRDVLICKKKVLFEVVKTMKVLNK